MAKPRTLIVAGLLLVLGAFGTRTVSQTLVSVTSPREEFGAGIGDDYFLATYTQLANYWQKLDAESDRLQLESIGQTEEGRTQWMAIVSAPENIKRLDDYKRIVRRLALAEATDADARALAATGKAVVWIDGGLHADEVLGAQQLIELVYELARADDAETLRILRDVIILVVHANPDGHALVADWYMRERDPLDRTLDGIPRPYQKYVGHDNNRDFFLSSQAETTNMNRILYKEWFPQIVFDHHQPAPPGTVMFAPPFSGPSNPVWDPLVSTTLDDVGAAIHARFATEGKRGVTMRDGAPYSTWWNGGLRTSAYFHNQIGLLTETTGHPTPMQIGAAPGGQLSTVDLPLPIAPQPWHFRQAVEYSMTANRAVLDFASRHRELLLSNAYRMAKRAIDEGSRDSWSAAPSQRAAVGGMKLRTPRGYVLPAGQPDFPTATKFVDALLKAGVSVHRATAAFRVDGIAYEAGSFVVRTAQPFRAHVLDMFEPQEHPYGGRPYDIAGWTLALQMGVKFDRVLDAFDGPFERVERVTPMRREIARSGVGYLLSHHQNDAAVVVNRLLRAGVPVAWLQDRSVGSRDRTGSIYVPSAPRAHDILAGAARELGVAVTGVAEAPAGSAWQLRTPRVGVWDRYGGAPSSGWIRWVLEQYEFPFDVVYAQQIDAGDLNARYDVLILPDEAVPQRVDRTPFNAPPEYRSQTGVLSAGRSVPALRRFVENGGTVVLTGQSARLAEQLDVSVREGARDRAGSAAVVTIPGSIVRVHVDNTVPLAYGFESELDVFFDNGPVFQPAGQGLTPLAWYGMSPLRSGWARGEEHLAGALAAVEAPVGRGHVVAFGPQIVFRAQSQAAFKFLFNAVYFSTAEPVGLPGSASFR